MWDTSQECRECRAARRRDPAVRFWPLVQKGEGCWEWQGAKEHHGHGRLRMHGKFIRAHRYSWELHYGPIPAGLAVCHKCDNPPCVRPDHLFLGTAADNAHDRDQKGRTSRGSEHAASVKNRLRGSGMSDVLTEADVVAIRSRVTGRFGEQSALAREYGVHPSVISNIVRRRRWTHV